MAHETQYRYLKTTREHTARCTTDDCTWSVAAPTKELCDAQTVFHEQRGRA